jgi:hypothetical protein
MITGNATNAQITKAFLAAIDESAKAEILANVAGHYGISPEEAFQEVTDDEAEHLLDYVTGPLRAATHVLMQRVMSADGLPLAEQRLAHAGRLASRLSF